MAAFCLAADVKAWLGGTWDGSEDSLLTALISQITTRMQQHMSRAIITATFSEVYNGTDQPSLSLRQIPILSVTSVAINGVAVPLASSPVTVGYLFDDKRLYLVPGTTVAPTAISRGVFTRGMQNVAVTYSAGLGASAPDDLKGACVQQASYEYRSRARIGEKSKSLSVGQATQTIGYITDEWLPMVKATLDRYTRKAPVA